VAEALYYEDLNTGDRWTSRARTVTESDVVGFAGLTGDFDPLHVDHEFAKQTPFGKPIAHGLFGLSLVAGLASQCPTVHTLAFSALRDWQFLAPIFIGDTVHAVTQVVDKQPNGRRSGRVVWNRQLVNQHGQVVQAGVFETLIAVRNPKSQARNPSCEQPAAALHIFPDPLRRSA
jgi:acyl dehydratase